MILSEKILLWVVVGLVTAVGMDAWSSFVHGKVWHGPLLRVHASHHRKRRGRFESNDALSLSHAPIAIALVLAGCVLSPSWYREVLFAVGLGMSAFGVAYVVVHDGLVHGRLPVRALERIPYLSRVRACHELHHDGSLGGAPYGLFLGPWEASRARARRARKRAVAVEAPHETSAAGPRARSTSP